MISFIILEDPRLVGYTVGCHVYGTINPSVADCTLCVDNKHQPVLQRKIYFPELTLIWC